MERSVDGSNGREIGRENGLANSSAPVKYSLEDRSPLAKAYYRLRSVDFDGQESYSPSVVLIRKSEHFGITSVFPSPMNKDVTVQFNARQEEKVTVRVLDIAGRLVMAQMVEAIQGINKLMLQLPGLPAGMYMVTVSDGTGISAPVQLVKQ